MGVLTEVECVMRRVLIAILSGVVMVLSLPLGNGARAGPNVQAAAGPPAMAGNCPFPGPNIAANHTGNPVSEEAIGDFRGAATIGDAAQFLVLSPDGTLSVDIEGVSLACVLHELGRQGEIAVRVWRPTADDAVSRKFRDQSLYEGVRLLLRGKSYLLLHAGPANRGDGSEAGPVVAIFVMDSGQRGLDVGLAALKAAPPSNTGAKPPPAQDDPDPAVRAAALLAVADKNNAMLENAVLWAIQGTGTEEDALREPVLGAGDWPDDFAVLVAGDWPYDIAPAEVLAEVVRSATTTEGLLQALALVSEISEELSMTAINQALDDPDPNIRDLALDTVEDLRMEAVFEAVAGAVQDDNRTVRLRAFSTLEDMYEFAPVWEVADSVIGDPDPQIRMRALELLAYGDRQAAIDRLAPALTDPSPKVSELAEDLLADLEQDPA